MIELYISLHCPALQIKGAAFEAPSAEQRIVDFKSDPDYMMAKIRAYLKQKARKNESMKVETLNSISFYAHLVVFNIQTLSDFGAAA